VDDRAVALSVDALVRRWESAESAEGIGAFFDKRKPGWVGQ
jgi:methylglutaconyl-CoA hydratase